LAKPVKRWEFLVGKLSAGDDADRKHGGDGGGLYLALWTVKHSFEKSDVYILAAVYLILLKLALIVGLALLFSCFTTPFLAILFSAGIYVAGVFAQNLRTMSVVDLNASTMKMLRGISYLLPNFENFNVMGTVAHGGVVPGRLILNATLYALVYCAIVLTGAAAIFPAELEMKREWLAGVGVAATVLLGLAAAWHLQERLMRSARRSMKSATKCCDCRS
jgi:ABC-type transport system involved in multi-copper enzyme maturation permease subunit